MRLSRRSFLKGVTASSLLAGTHVLGSAGRAWAAGTGGSPVLVLVNLVGGNDLLNTVVPLDDVGGPQRSRYEALRPNLAVPLSALSATRLDHDPGLGTGLALHPSLGGVKQLYDEGRVACVLGAGLPGSSLSPFEAEKSWFVGRPDVVAGATGWVGRQLDLVADGQPHAVSFGGVVSATLDSERADVLGVRSVANFRLPGRTAHAALLQEILAEGRAGVLERVARSGRILLDQASFLGGIATTGWGSHLEAEASGPGRDLREIAALLRHDALDPGAASGFGFHHVRVFDYDTHSRQGVLDTSAGHPRLLSDLDRWLTGFQRDLETLGVSDRVLTLVYSEFGRRAAQNANGADAGTDHGRGGLMLLLGDRVAGGVHGRMPRLDALDATGSLAVTTDFRTVYAAVIDDFLGGDHTAVLPGAPFAKLPLIQPA